MYIHMYYQYSVVILPPFSPLSLPLPPPPSVYALSPCSTPVSSSGVCADLLDACRGVSDAALEMLRAMKADDPGEGGGSNTWVRSLVCTYVHLNKQMKPHDSHPLPDCMFLPTHDPS